MTGYDDWDVLEAVGNGAMEQYLEGQKTDKKFSGSESAFLLSFTRQRHYKFYYKNTLRSTSETLTRFLIQLLRFMTKNKRTPHVAITSHHVRPTDRLSVSQYQRVTRLSDSQEIPYKIS